MEQTIDLDDEVIDNIQCVFARLDSNVGRCANCVGAYAVD